MVRANSSYKIFELSKVRFKDVKTYGYKTGFVVEVHVLNDNSKRVTVIWDGDDHADSKLFRVTDLIAVECEKGQEINRALAYKQRKADRLKQERQRHNKTVEDANNSMSKTEILRSQISNSIQASKLKPGTSTRQERIQIEDINLDARNYQVC